MQIKSSITKSAKFDRLEFPTRKDYIKYFIENQFCENENEIWGNEKFVSIIHRHWHGEGRNGCIFALLAARKAEERGWQDFVITKSIDLIESEDTKALIRKRIIKAIQDSNCEVLSLLFSNITTTKDLVRLIKQLLEIDIIRLVDEKVFDKWVALALRVPINSDEVLSWLMAFAPLDYFPQTRQSPIVEIAIRVKGKPDNLFHRLNNDKEAAHLADIPLNFLDHVMEKTWTNTLKRTRVILGEEPNHFSSAKVTLTIPKKEWLEK